MFNYGGNFGSYGAYNPQQQMYQQQMQAQAQANLQAQIPMRTNKIFVTSIEEAMAKYAEPNTEVVYYHQDKPMLIEVKTDIQGRKTCNVFDLTPHQAESEKVAVVYATKEEVEEIVRREIQNAIDRKKKNTQPLESKIKGDIE